MKRPLEVWFFSILIIFSLFGSVAPFIDVFLTHTSAQSFIPHAELFAIFAIIWGLLGVVFLYLFFMLKKSSLTFLYILFAYGTIFNIILKNWIAVVVEIIIVATLWGIITRKKIDGQPVFT